MDFPFNDMDSFFIHLRPLPRRFPGPAPVSSIGYAPQKTDRVQRMFVTFNFSFILSGRGRYRLNDHTYLVEAPAVLLQWPGQAMDYGPHPAGATWEELFLIYDLSEQDALMRWGLRPAEHPVWRLRASRMVRAQAEWLLQHSGQAGQRGMADRFDAVCERLILEARLGEESPSPTPGDDAVEAIRDIIMAQLDQPHDFDQLAREHGLSPMTFRRRWAGRYDEPPHRCLLNLRMREACRLLAETDTPIKEIARLLGFDDALYFSRRFRQQVGVAASDYRQQHGPHA